MLIAEPLLSSFIFLITTYPIPFKFLPSDLKHYLKMPKADSPLTSPAAELTVPVKSRARRSNDLSNARR